VFLFILASFNCPLVHSLPFCPGVAYSVPLPAPSRTLCLFLHHRVLCASSCTIALPLPAPPEPDVTLPISLHRLLHLPCLSYMANFTTVRRLCYLVGCPLIPHHGPSWYSLAKRRREPRDKCDSSFFWFFDVFKVYTMRHISDPFNDHNPSISSVYLLRANASKSKWFHYCSRSWCYRPRRISPNKCSWCTDRSFCSAPSTDECYTDGKQNKGLAGVSQDRWGNVWCRKI
jgi:calcium channel MID1